MSAIPRDLKYTEHHIWLRLDGDGLITAGITDFAQETLGDLVYIELPDIGTRISAGQPAALVESVKAAADVHAPLDGVVVDVNRSAVVSPEALNRDAYGTWLLRIQPDCSSDFDQLLDAEDYLAILDIPRDPTANPA